MSPASDRDDPHWVIQARRRLNDGQRAQDWVTIPQHIFDAGDPDRTTPMSPRTLALCKGWFNDKATDSLSQWRIFNVVTHRAVPFDPYA